MSDPIDKLVDAIHARIWSRVFIVVISAAIILFIFSILSGCVTDREMMEYNHPINGDYECIVLQDSRVFCK